MVRYLGERAQREHLTNLVPVQASADAANLPEPVDVVLVVDTYHHIGNRTQYFARVKSSLRPTGHLAIVDFKADSPSGPPAQYRISPERVTEELNAAGYALMETLQFLPRQYYLVFRTREQKFLPKHTTDGHRATSLSSRHWSWAATCARASTAPRSIS
jgi:cyclopropane fatty-acyl-phospholipid synthase-like methyltransferase